MNRSVSLGMCFAPLLAALSLGITGCAMDSEPSRSTDWTLSKADPKADPNPDNREFAAPGDPDNREFAAPGDPDNREFAAPNDPDNRDF